jgi:superfamily II DNA/RNA helicase
MQMGKDEGRKPRRIRESVEEELVEGNRESMRSDNRTRHLILDESDRLLSSDFLPQIQPIVEACTHSEIQKCFLSATMPAGPEAIASKWLNEGVRVVVGLK